MPKKQTVEERQKYHDDLTVNLEMRWGLLKQQQPSLNMNTFEARMNRFVDQLVEWGVITREQLVEFNIQQLEEIEDTIVEVEKKMKARQSPQQTIAVPEKRLIIPGRG